MPKRATEEKRLFSHDNLNFPRAPDTCNHCYFSVSAFSVVAMLKSHTRSVLCLHVDDDVIVSGSEDKTLRIFDRKAGKLWKTLQVEKNTLFKVLPLQYSNFGSR